MSGEAHVDPHEQKEGLEHWIEIDCAAGIGLCALAGLLFAGAVSGWLLIFADLTELRSRLDRMQTERTSQISDVGQALRVMEMRIEAVSGRLQRLQHAPRTFGDGSGAIGRKCRNLEKVFEAQCVLEDDAALSPGEEAR